MRDFSFGITSSDGLFTNVSMALITDLTKSKKSVFHLTVGAAEWE